MSGDKQPSETKADCMSCKVTGTVVCTLSSGYLLAQTLRHPAPSPTNNMMLLTFAGAFAGMAIYRGLT